MTRGTEASVRLPEGVAQETGSNRTSSREEHLSTIRGSPQAGTGERSAAHVSVSPAVLSAWYAGSVSVSASHVTADVLCSARHVTADVLCSASHVTACAWEEGMAPDPLASQCGC